MKPKIVIGTALLVLAGCASVPSTPALGPGEKVLAGGEVLSKQGGYGVVIKKIDAPDESVKALTQYGLPMTVQFVNLSEAPVMFGPDNIVVKRDGKDLKLVSAKRIAEVKDSEHASNSFLGFLAAVATVAGAVASTNPAVAASNPGNNPTGIATTGTGATMEILSKGDQINAEKEALTRQFEKQVLSKVAVAPKAQVGGTVYVQGARASDPITVIVRTADVEHTFSFAVPHGK